MLSIFEIIKIQKLDDLPNISSNLPTNGSHKSPGERKTKQEIVNLLRANQV